LVLLVFLKEFIITNIGASSGVLDGDYAGAQTEYINGGFCCQSKQTQGYSVFVAVN
jgi:hypothetical protein